MGRRKLTHMTRTSLLSEGTTGFGQGVFFECLGQQTHNQTRPRTRARAPTASAHRGHAASCTRQSPAPAITVMHIGSEIENVLPGPARDALIQELQYMLKPPPRLVRREPPSQPPCAPGRYSKSACPRIRPRPRRSSRHILGRGARLASRQAPLPPSPLRLFPGLQEPPPCVSAGAPCVRTGVGAWRRRAPRRAPRGPPPPLGAGLGEDILLEELPHHRKHHALPPPTSTPRVSKRATMRHYTGRMNREGGQ